ncbi:MAG: ribonuclease Z [Bacteroidota bacterium]|nr:ribonuclease Z [Bacteroidota bacterium]
MIFSVTVLGCNSAIPTLTRNPSAHLLNANERFFLFDCAEGTQLQLRRYKIRFQRISRIFISHLHGDHYYGLIGLLTSFHLLGRKDPLDLYGHPLLKQILDIQLEASQTRLIYPIRFHEIGTGYELLHEDDILTVHSFPVIHSVPTCGFIVREKEKERKIRKDKIARLNIPVEAMPGLKRGMDFTDSMGHIHLNKELTIDPPRPRSYVYCGDTSYTESIIPYIKDCNLLYHEATFMQDMVASAHEKKHSTAAEAATIALKAGAGKLLIGHYSARYDNLQPLLEEAKKIFPETYLAEEGKTYKIPDSLF